MSNAEISICLWFDTAALEAATLYTSLFDDARITEVFYRGGDPAQGAFTVSFTLMGQRFWGLNGGPMYSASPAASICAYVETQEELDRIWSALLEGGGKESRCGWLTDRFGISWQIIPKALARLLKTDKSGRVLQAMMGMIKMDIAALDAAAKG